MLEADYFYDGRLRWNLGFANPNHAGAWVALWLPVLWWFVAETRTRSEQLRSTSSARNSWLSYICLLLVTLAWLGEGIGWWALAHTGSRAALLSALGALVVFTLARRAAGRQAFGGFLVRLALALLCWGASGFGGRTATGYLAQDASISNRLTLWKGGLRMIAAAPWHGWGSGESGRMYEEYFQPLTDTEHYRSLVSSYLTVAAEYGLPMLGRALWVFLCAMLLAWRMARLDENEGRSRLGALICAVVAGALAVHGWSNLWIVHALWYAPCVAVILVLGMALWSPGKVVCEEKAGAPSLMKPLVWASVLTLMILTAIWAGGLMLPSTERVLRDASGCVSLEKAGAPEGQSLAVYPDAAVLGDRPGAECRRLLALPSVGRVMVDCRPSTKLDAVLLCGSRASLASGLSNRGRIIFVHPTGSPNDFVPLPGTVVVLPELSLEPGDEAWTEWAKSHAVPVRYSPRCGRDVRSAWPAILPK